LSANALHPFNLPAPYPSCLILRPPAPSAFPPSRLYLVWTPSLRSLLLVSCSFSLPSHLATFTPLRPPLSALRPPSSSLRSTLRALRPQLSRLKFPPFFPSFFLSFALGFTSRCLADLAVFWSFSLFVSWSCPPPTFPRSHFHTFYLL